MADYIYVCAAQVFAALQSEFRGILLDILGVSSRPAVVRNLLFPLTPEYIAAGDVWITTGTDGQIAGFVRSCTPRMRLFIDPAAASAVRCSAVRRGAAGAHWT